MAKKTVATLLGFDAKLNIFRIRENKVQASFWFVGTKELRAEVNADTG